MHARDEQTGEIRRMSKSARNVVTPDSMAERYGADALRLYLLFMAPFENNTIWDEDGMAGPRRFLDRAWKLVWEVAGRDSGPDRTAQGETAPSQPGTLTRTSHRTVKRVTEETERFRFNTAVAALMEYLNALTGHRQEHGITAELVQTTRDFVLVLAPFAPFIAEALWERMGGPYSVHQQPWPAWDESLVAEETVTLVVQVDGRVRDRVQVTAGIDQPEAERLALASPAVQRAMGGRAPLRVIYVPGRLVNLVSR